MSLRIYAFVCLAVLEVCLWRPIFSAAQGNFEIQVYGSETTEPGKTMIELHSNTAIKGTTERQQGVFPTQHAWHETIEITHGFTPWFETGFTSSPAYSPMRAGSGLVTISVPGSKPLRAGISLSG